MHRAIFFTPNNLHRLPLTRQYEKTNNRTAPLLHRTSSFLGLGADCALTMRCRQRACKGEQYRQRTEHNARKTRSRQTDGRARDTGVWPCASSPEQDAHPFGSSVQPCACALLVRADATLISAAQKPVHEARKHSTVRTRPEAAGFLEAVLTCSRCAIRSEACVCAHRLFLGSELT